MFDLIYYIVYGIINSISITLVVNNINPMKLNNKNKIKFFFMIFFLSYTLFRLGFNIFQVPVIIIFIAIYLYIAFKSIYKGILTAFFTGITFIGGDAIAGLFIVKGLNLTQQQLMSNKIVYIITLLLVSFNSYILSKGANKIVKEILQYKKYINKYYKRIDIYILSLVFGVYCIALFSISYKALPKLMDSRITALIFWSNLCFYALTILLIYTFNNNIKIKLENKYTEKELEQLVEYTNILENMSSSIRNFKHDYLNILQLIGGFIEEENMKGLKKFYSEELLPESNEVLLKDKCFMQLQHIKIGPLKTLISSKLMNAQSQGIKVNIEVMEDLDEVSIKVLDICRIIGNFLDNALEGALLSKEKTIQFIGIKGEDKVILIIKNSCSEDTPPVYKIYEKNFSTKGSDRGIGLKNVREIIDKKYDKIFLNTKIRNCVFEQELIIYNSKKLSDNIKIINMK